MASLGREHQRLGQVVEHARELERMESELAQARELASFDDPELVAEARREIDRLTFGILRWRRR